MPHFHVIVQSKAHVRADFDIYAASLEDVEISALESAGSGDVLWRYDGLVEDAEIEIEK